MEIRLTEQERDSIACRCHSGLCPLHNEASDGYVEHEVGELLAAVERIVADRLTAMEALAGRWADVLTECKQASPNWILDQSITTLATNLGELRAALAQGGGDR